MLSTDKATPPQIIVRLNIEIETVLFSLSILSFLFLHIFLDKKMSFLYLNELQSLNNYYDFSFFFLL